MEDVLLKIEEIRKTYY